MTEEKTPKQIVELLDKYIIGQNEAKKSVAVALYNRYRRLQDRKSTRLNSSHIQKSRMPSSA